MKTQSSIFTLDCISSSSSSCASCSSSGLAAVLSSRSDIWNSVPIRRRMTGSGSPGASGISGGSSPVSSPSLMQISLRRARFSRAFSSSASRLAFRAATISALARFASSVSSFSWLLTDKCYWQEQTRYRYALPWRIQIFFILLFINFFNFSHLAVWGNFFEKIFGFGVKRLGSGSKLGQNSGSGSTYKVFGSTTLQNCRLENHLTNWCFLL